MQHLIIVRSGPQDQFTAEAVGIPELTATAATKIKAIKQVESQLAEWVKTGQLVRAELPEENPALEWAGWAKDDPDYESYLAEIRRFRQEENERDRLPSEEPLPPPEYPKLR